MVQDYTKHDNPYTLSGSPQKEVYFDLSTAISQRCSYSYSIDT